MLKAPTAKGPRNDVRDDEQNEDDEDPNLDVLPPHVPLQRPGTGFEPVRGALQLLALVDKQLDLFAALKHLVDVLHHDRLDRVQAGLDATDGVGLGVVKNVHPVLKVPLELGVEAEGNCRVDALAKVRPKLGLDILEVRERVPALVALVSQAHVDEPVVDEHVEDVAVVGIRRLRVLGAKASQHRARHRGEVPRAGRVLGEHRRASGDERVENGHFPRDRPTP
mmetsp:Transcript_9634/g.37506  ORF Transcript_9634/g.37506 Transcript_9634/m.37506 type:complete len:223 (-) Transcript_9634:8-676(-)